MSLSPRESISIFAKFPFGLSFLTSSKKAETRGRFAFAAIASSLGVSGASAARYAGILIPFCCI